MSERAFSVLLPVYRGDRLAHFERALRSVGAEQTLASSEIVIVRDGPVGEELQELLDAVAAGRRRDLVADVPVRIEALAENVGLARALNHGLAACAHDVVARADADDISLPQRFAEQLPMVLDEGNVLVGAAVREFEDEGDETGMVRRMPLTSGEIRRVVTLRDPFNHPTVIYRRSAVEAVGGYEHLDLLEDYLLFARMVASGVRCANHPDPLVLYRVGAGAYDRRGGTRLLRSELRLQRLLRREGVVTPVQWARNVAVRAGYRLVPSGLRRVLYRAVGVRHWFGSQRQS